MRLGIMQPYFFPYLAHFGLIAAVDRWIVFDTSQYTPRGWMNRNRVLHPQGGWSYVTVPLANGSIGIRTQDALLLDPPAARRSVLGKLSHYRRLAPHYAAVASLVEEAFRDDDRSLVRLNLRGLRAVCRYLGLPFRADVLSELDLALPAGLGPGDWALEICAALGADGYLNPAGGQALFDPAAFAARGIDLCFAEAAEFRYPTGRLQYEPGLSVLDVLMWVAPDQALDAVRGLTRVLAAPVLAVAR
jgi:hypothetical protein